MKIFTFLQLIHGILNKVIDDIQFKISSMEEDDLPNEDELDKAAFKLISNTVADMEQRYNVYKAEVESDPDQAEAIRHLRLVLNDTEEPDDNSGNNGGLH